MSKSLQSIAAIILLSAATAQAQTASHAVPGQVVIKFKTDGNFLAASASLEILGITVVKTLPELAVVVGEFPSKKNIEDMTRACNALPNVEYAEPNYYVYALEGEKFEKNESGHATMTARKRATIIPNDPRFNEQWYLNQENDADIDAPEAWDITTGSSEVVVGIVDTGIDYDHEDLRDNIWRNPGESGGGKESNGIDDDNNGYTDDFHGWDFANDDNDPTDDNGGGTHAAGIVGATGNNGQGIAGLNWRVQLMPLKFFRGDGSGNTEDAIEAIVYAAKMGAKILCNNWGGSGDSRSLQDAIQYAHENGVLFIATAGRAGSDVDATPNYPSGYDIPNVVAVTSSDRDDKLIGNFGRRSVDLAAPGLNILSAQPLSRYQLLSTGATPQVAGVCALVWAQYPNLKPYQVLIRVLGSVNRKFEFTNLMTTEGRLNAANALSTNPIIAYTTVMENSINPGGPYFIRTSVVDDGMVSSVLLAYTVNGKQADTLKMTSGENDIYGANIPGQPFNSNITYMVMATDNDGNRTASLTFSFAVGAISAPLFNFKTFPRVTNDPTPAFEWQDIAEATAYHVSLSFNPDFFPGFVDSTISPFYKVPSPLPDGAWYIRIRSVVKPDVVSLWSKGEFFTVDAAAPSDAAIRVNGDSAYVKTRAVILQFDASGVRPGIDSVRFANGDESEEVRWSLFEERTRAWQLAEGKDGPRKVYIQFKDRAGNCSKPDSDGVFLDTAPPFFSSASLRVNPDKPGVGDTVKITLDPPQDGGGIKRVDWFYRRAGENWQSVPLRNNSAHIPPQFITPRGVDFKITAEDSAGNLGFFRNGRLYFFSLPVSIRPGEAGSFPGSPGGTTAAAYRLVSLPLIVANPAVSEVFTNLGAYGVKRDYRFWRLEADRQWREEGDQLKVQPGESYFLITRQSKRLSNKSAGVTAQTADGALGNFPGWRLRADDWTLIGNPFNFEIAVENLRLKNRQVNLSRDSTLKVWSYNGEWEMNPVRLEKWGGLAVRNTGAVDTLLYLPPLDEASPGSTIAEKNTLNPSNAENEWTLPIRAESEVGRDYDNYFGVRQGARPGRDQFDYDEPPLLPGGVSLSFLADGVERPKALAVDIRPPQQQGYEWILLIQSQSENIVKMHFEDLEKFPPGLEIWLVDDALQITQNLRESNRYAVAGSEQPKQLKLVVGIRDFVNEKITEAQAIPTRYELSQNFPNPFNPATTIRYGLPQVARVTLKIYNLLGEEVATLVHDEQKAAGYHAAIWDGRNKNGVVVASGVYVYRLQAGSFSATKKLALIK